MRNFYFYYLTGNDPIQTISKQGITFRKALYPIIRRLSGPMTKVKGVSVKMEPLPKGPKIYAVTHTYSREDIAWGISFAGEQSFLITNAYKELFYTSDGVALWASGIILVDRYNKENRQASLKKAERVINLGGNVMIFPEAVWNMSPNLLVRKLFPGVYKLACMSRVPVIPISTMMYDNRFYVSRGKPLYLYSYRQDEGLTILRDTLATLKWEIMEQYGSSTRAALLQGQEPEEFWTNHIENYIAKQTIYEREEEENAHYIDDADIEQFQVQEDLRRLKPSRNNAFLFGKGARK